MNILILLLSLTAIIIAATFLYSWYRLRKSLSAPIRPNKDTPATYNLKYSTRHFKTSDGITLEGWYIPAKNAKAVVIVVHGYLDTKATILGHAGYLYKGGYSTFFIDLRSDKKGVKYTFGVNEWKDVAAAYDYMRSLPENKNIKIGYSSGSMGAAAAIAAAGKTGKGDFVIASVPYTNFKSMFSFQISVQKLPLILLPFVQTAALIEFGLKYEDHAPDRNIVKIKKPIFLMSATYDNMVNTNDAKHLFSLANEPKIFWQADTNHVIFKEDPKEFEKRMLHFLSKIS
jgi:alpha-beta hydrolase superfamily lysophospholipase